MADQTKNPMHQEEVLIAVKDGKIRFYNNAAAKLIENIGSKTPEEIFPCELLAHGADSYVGGAVIAGVLTTVTVTMIDDCRIMSFYLPVRKCDRETYGLLSAVSMELKNMLSVLKMSSNLLLPYIENLGNPRLVRYGAMIYHCYYNMLRITNNLSDLDGILRDDVPMDRKSFDLVAVCRDLIDSAQHLVQGTGVTLKFSSDEQNLVIYADQSKIEKMVLNLLSNSLACTPPGGNLAVSVMSANMRCVVTVSDDGQGIDSEALRSAWNKYHVLKEISDTETGLGMGLTIVQNIARLHGGSAVLESRPGAGTTVTVSIPLTQPDETDFRTSRVDYESEGMQQLLTELSGVISYDQYSQLYMD
ncbi:HAMP domain-containing sensor histidine kinase [Oscillospiraceae bacterium WX1]